MTAFTKRKEMFHKNDQWKIDSFSKGNQRRATIKNDFMEKSKCENTRSHDVRSAEAQKKEVLPIICKEILNIKCYCLLLSELKFEENEIIGFPRVFLLN